jgi:hypothetical protein
LLWITIVIETIGDIILHIKLIYNKV